MHTDIDMEDIKLEDKTKIIAVAGKGGVGKTSLAGVIVKLLVESFPDKKILAIDADPAVGLSTVLNVDVDKTIDDIRKEVIKNVEDGDTKSAVELLGEAKYEIYDALKEQDGYAFIAIGRPKKGCQVVKTIKGVADELVMYDKIGVIANRLPNSKVTELMDIGDMQLLAAIESDEELARADVLGENVLKLSDDTKIVKGAREALANIGIL